ncbi:Crp/Fnr family transcriptional regulator [Pseudorhodobacter sp. MZDSW-24AT]|uniref:Crp/Fnr family transcriptional regulator n=1 Tax=Pseudorhodobacter sp. MZDSW-24AT TaxID=2052957 RepID=UPI000C1E7509|nr:Crp/Fnr family transcriptional regulator [Pseudorhodobacter sp. MZDSW-24AT]PJF11065.1 Crp/Fnr family transcriptional regulator [Pseudorhodobacter sp. MZDSW-24AT]
MTDDEVRFMERFKKGELSVARGATILSEGEPSGQLYTVLSGLGLRHKTLENGQRQVLNLIFPGDFLGLQAGLMGEMGHSVEAVTPMVLCVFDRSGLWSLFQNNPARAYDLTWIAAVEEHFLGETVATIGQRDATAALAWAFLRIFRRGESLGLVRDGKMSLPYRQQDMADALGLSLVHTNKRLQRFRAAGLMDWSRGILHIPDRNALASIANLHDRPAEKRPIL